MRRPPLLFGFLGLALTMFATPARAGAPPDCPPGYTLEKWLAEYEHAVVLVRALVRTRRGKGDALWHEVTVEKVYRGAVRGKRLRLADCAHWKCDSARFRAGERATLVLTRVCPRCRWFLGGPSCDFRYGSVYPPDPQHPGTAALLAAIRHLAPPR